mgnify:CR=1 FL=1
MSRFIIRRAKAEDGAALCAIYAPYITDTTITFEYEVPTDAAFSDRIRETAAQFPYLVCEKDGGIIGYAGAAGALDGMLDAMLRFLSNAWALGGSAIVLAVLLGWLDWLMCRRIPVKG